MGSLSLAYLEEVQLNCALDLEQLWQGCNCKRCENNSKRFLLGLI